MGSSNERTGSYLYDHSKTIQQTPSLISSMRGSAGSRWAAAAVSEPSSKSLLDRIGIAPTTSPTTFTTISHQPTNIPSKAASPAPQSNGLGLSNSTASTRDSGWDDHTSVRSSPQESQALPSTPSSTEFRYDDAPHSDTIINSSAPQEEDGWAAWSAKPNCVTGQDAFVQRQKMTESTATSACILTPIDLNPSYPPTNLRAPGANCRPTPIAQAEEATASFQLDDPKTASKEVEDPWAAWQASAQKDAGGAQAFARRQAMTSSSSDLAPAKAAPPPGGPGLGKKNHKPLQPPPKKQNNPSLPLEPKPSTGPSKATRSSPPLKPIPMLPIKKSVTPSPAGSAGTHSTLSTPFGRYVKKRAEARASASSAGEMALPASSGFPPGSLLDQVANSAVVIERPASAAAEASGPDTLDRIKKALDKVRAEVARQKLPYERLMVDAAVQAPEKDLIDLSIEEYSSILDVPNDDKEQGMKPMLLVLLGLEIAGKNANGEAPMTRLPLTSTQSAAVQEDKDSRTISPLPTQVPLPSSPLSTTSFPTSSSHGLSMQRQDSSVRLLKKLENLGYKGDSQDRLHSLLSTLPKRDQALCLFNDIFLKQKVVEALDVIAAEDGLSEEEL